MKILLASNSPFYPSYGGGDKSNRLLMRALAARGHEVHILTRVAHPGQAEHAALLAHLRERGIPHDDTRDGVRLAVDGLEVLVMTRHASLRAWSARHIAAFDADVILTSTDDPAHVLLEPALAAPRARVVYLIRATVALPFGPDAALASAAKTRALARVDAAVGVSEYVAAYAREHGGLDAVYRPISLLEPGPCPRLGRFDNPWVLMVNPCAVKGLSIFLGLARLFPGVEFAAIPTWGTTDADRAALAAQPNVRLLDPVDDIDEAFARTRVALVPSLWAEARSRVILEAMSRGIPVLASDVGGLREAKLGVEYLLPVNPVTRYQAGVDALMVPLAEVPEQNLEPWRAALGRLLQDRAHYDALATESRAAALSCLETLTAEPFEALLREVAAAPQKPRLTPEKRRLLALRLKQKGPLDADSANS